MWSAEIIRYTFFPIQGTEVDPKQLFLDVFGSEADEINIKPSDALHEYRKNLDFGVAILTKRPEKIDLVFRQPVENLFDSEAQIDELNLELNFGLVRSYRNTLFAAPSFPPINRLACGTIVLQPVSNEIEGIQQISSLVQGLDIDPSNSSNFMFKLNRKGLVTVNDSEYVINRLVDWRVITVQRILPEYSDSSQPFIRVELDINTSQNNKDALAGKDSLGLIENLEEMILSIITEGY